MSRTRYTLYTKSKSEIDSLKADDEININWHRSFKTQERSFALKGFLTCPKRVTSESIDWYALGDAATEIALGTLPSV